MADVEKPSGTDTRKNDAERTSPLRKRPPKLRRRVNPAPELGEASGDMDGELGYPKANHFADRDLAPTGASSDRAESHSSEPEPLAAELEHQISPQRAEPSEPTAELDRPKPASLRKWQKKTRGRRGNQSLVPLGGIDEVGKPVSGALDAVQDVGSNAVRSAGNTLGKVTGGAVQSLGNEDKGKDEQLRLRLDLNLDIEVQLKAKIHGDLTLQLLN